jgi:flagellar hook-length control protein FliK
MAQINTLAIELPKGTDSKAESSVVGSSKRKEENNFSQYMERQLLPESKSSSGNKSLEQHDKQVISIEMARKGSNKAESIIVKSEHDSSTNLSEDGSDSNKTQSEAEENISTQEQTTQETGKQEQINSALAQGKLAENTSDITEEVDTINEQATATDIERGITDKIEQSQEFISLLFSAENMLNKQVSAEVNTEGSAKKDKSTDSFSALFKTISQTELAVVNSSDEVEKSAAAQQEINKTLNTDEIASIVLAEKIEGPLKKQLLSGSKELSGADTKVATAIIDETVMQSDDIVDGADKNELLLDQIKASGILNNETEGSINDMSKKKETLSGESVIPGQKIIKNGATTSSTSENNNLPNGSQQGGGATIATSDQVVEVMAVIADKNAQGIETDKKGNPVVNQSTKEILAKLSADSNEQQSQDGESGNSEPDSNQEKQSKDLTGNEQFSKIEAGKLETGQTKSASATITAQAGTHNAIGSNITSESLAQPSENMLDAISSKATAVESTQTAKATNIQNEAVSVYKKDFADNIKEKVMVMINQKLQQVEIRLDPQELGHMHIRVNLQNEQAAINFVVQNQQAKEALEQNMGKLKEMLSEGGVEVGDANIEQNNSNDGSNDQSDNSSAGEQTQFDNEDSEVDSAIIHTSLAKASSSAVDYYA